MDVFQEDDGIVLQVAVPGEGTAQALMTADQALAWASRLIDLARRLNG